MTTASRAFEHERTLAIRAVRQAARLCQAVGGEISPDVLAKKDSSPVTVADFGSQALICRILAQEFPHDPVIAEEDSTALARPDNAQLLQQVLRQVRRALASEAASGGNDATVEITQEQVCRWIDHGGTREYSSRFWTLDPIDGTKGFLRGEQYAVALALVVDGCVTVATLACPNLPVEPLADSKDATRARGVIFHAIRGQRAFMAAAGQDAVSEATEVRVSDRVDPREARFCESVESGHSAHTDAAAVAARLGVTSPPLRIDSQAKYAVVARGEADLYLRLPTRPDYREKIWDHAAGALIVAEAGGVVTDIAGLPLEFQHGCELAANRGVIVSNGRLHELVITVLRALNLASA
jgi:3'(2'), 5'-bisphosphate nucleotidase